MKHGPTNKGLQITSQISAAAEDATAEYPDAPARLTANQAEQFNELLRERPASYWRPIDLVLVAQFCILWSKYLVVALQIEDAEPTLDGKVNPLYVAHERLYRTVDSMMRRLCLAPVQRIVNDSTQDPKAIKAALTRQAQVKEVMQGDNLLAKPMH